MRFLRHGTQVVVRIGPFVDVGDGFTPETGVTLAGADEAELLKNTGGVVDISGATWAAITTADGYYDLTLTTSHLDTLGQLAVVVQDDSVCLPVVAYFMVLPAAVYDSMFGDGSTEAGTAQGGDDGEITLRAAASAVSDIFNNQIVRIIGGTGAGQAPRYIHDYDGTSKVALISPDWLVNPDATSVYVIDPAPPAPTDSSVLPAVDAASVRAAVGLASADLDTQLGALPTNAELATALGTADDAVLAAIAALNNLSAAQVNAEVVDALATDTYAEIGTGTPAATASLAVKIGWLYKNWRNRKTQTADEWALFNDDASTKGQEAAVADDGTTASKAEITTGA